MDSRTKELKLCQIALAGLALGGGVLLLCVSFSAALSVAEKLQFIDYWLEWFAFFSFLGGIILSAIGLFFAGLFFADLCDHGARTP